MRRGFTIVELLIVIVVIAILAAITIVSYNGIQQQATNTKTTSALASWMKILNMYKVENGRWPSGGVCLGSGYLFGESGTQTSGTAQCRQSGVNGVLENTAFNNTLKPYSGGSLPTPAFVTAVSSSTEWRRGLMYYFGGGDGTQVYIQAAYQGDIGCPSAGIAPSSRSLWGGNTMCTYTLGTTSDT